jgi:hypothetical protein
MNKLAFGLLFIAFSVHAFDDPLNVVATIRNNAGGEIVFTNRKVSHCAESSFEVYSVSGSNDVIIGCWSLFDNYLIVVWSDGTTKAFSTSDVKVSDWVGKIPNKPLNDKPKKQV